MNYPVNTKSKWAIYDIETSSVIKEGVSWPRQDGMAIVGQPSNHIMLEYADADQPVFDASTQRVEANQQRTVDLDNNKYLRTWNVVDKTQQEIHFEAIETGYLVEPEGFTLALQENDQNAFTRLLTLLSVAGVSDDTSTIIADKDGVLRTATYGRLKEILTAYGIYYQQLWAATKA
jgi:hypothetical protein